MNIILMRGLPGSGKSTSARYIQSLFPNTSAIVSKDAIRMMLYPNKAYAECNLYMIQDLRDTLLRELRYTYDVENIIIDETFVEVEDIENAVTYFTLWDHFFIIDHTSVDSFTCLLRQTERPLLSRVSEEAMTTFEEALKRDKLLFDSTIKPWMTIIEHKDIFKEDFRALLSRTHRDEMLSVPQRA